MNKHTPGPWVATQDPSAVNTEDWCIGAQGQIDMIAVCSEANARLIAAAPDLLEALQNLENDDGCIPKHAWDMVQNAINKASGVKSD
jgi:hypothetical protein